MSSFNLQARPFSDWLFTLAISSSLESPRVACFLRTIHSLHTHRATERRSFPCSILGVSWASSTYKGRGWFGCRGRNTNTYHRDQKVNALHWRSTTVNQCAWYVLFVMKLSIATLPVSFANPTKASLLQKLCLTECFVPKVYRFLRCYVVEFTRYQAGICLYCCCSFPCPFSLPVFFLWSKQQKTLP